MRAKQIDDFPGRYAGDEGRYFGRAEPPAPRNFVTRFGGRVLRKIDEENEMSFAEAAKLEQVRELRTNERSLFFQLALGCIQRRLGTLDRATGQRPPCPRARDQKHFAVPTAYDRRPSFHSLPYRTCGWCVLKADYGPCAGVRSAEATGGSRAAYLRGMRYVVVR